MTKGLITNNFLLILSEIFFATNNIEKTEISQLDETLCTFAIKTGNIQKKLIKKENPNKKQKIYIYI